MVSRIVNKVGQSRIVNKVGQIGSRAAAHVIGSHYEDKDECARCLKPLSNQEKKHCKRCLQTVCDTCSPHRRQLEDDRRGEVRVCDLCETQIDMQPEIDRLKREHEDKLKADAERYDKETKQMTMEMIKVEYEIRKK